MMRWSLLGWLFFGCGCAMTPGPADEVFDARRAQVEAWIQEQGLAEDPAVEAQRAQLDAALAAEKENVPIDSVELRARVSHGGGNPLGLRARVPLDGLLELPARREASRASSEAALARLREAGLVRRAAQCLPALDRSLWVERSRIFERYAERQRSLRDWNRQLESGGLIDEVASTRFELSSQMRLDTRAPTPLPPVRLPEGPVWKEVLPEPPAQPGTLALDDELVRKQITLHQPEWEVHRALANRYRSLARAAHASRLPSLEFIDLAFEPASGRSPSRFGAQVGVEIPFGRKASAREEGSLAMARSHESRSRFVLQDRFRLAEAALFDLRAFDQRGATWLRLTELADRSEHVADRWRREQLAEPRRIASLLEDVYDARLAILAERERAGLAGCSLLAATGIPIQAWPRLASPGPP